MKKYFIYGLKDPIDHEIKYVGKSIDPMRRYKRHLNIKSHIYERSSGRCNWIEKLRILNLVPILEIIEECDEDNWINREKYWIHFYRKKGNIFNILNGGDGNNYYKDRDRPVNGLLTFSQVKEIREKYKSGTITPKQLAAEYKMSERPMRDILSNSHYFDPDYTKPEFDTKRVRILPEEISDIREYYLLGYGITRLVYKFNRRENIISDIVKNNIYPSEEYGKRLLNRKKVTCHKKISEEEIINVKILFSEGYSVSEICRKLNIDEVRYFTIKQKLKKWNFTIKT